jgi:hypothetical protein
MVVIIVIAWLLFTVRRSISLLVAMSNGPRVLLSVTSVGEGGSKIYTFNKLSKIILRMPLVHFTF